MSRDRVARSHGQVVGRGLGRRGGWKIAEGWLTGTRRTFSTERTIDPGSARRGGRRDIALSPFSYRFGPTAVSGRTLRAWGGRPSSPGRWRARTEPAADGGRSAATGLSSVDLAEWRGGRRATGITPSRDTSGGAGGSCRNRAADDARPITTETRRVSASPDHTVRPWAEGWGGEVDGRSRKNG